MTESNKLANGSTISNDDPKAPDVFEALEVADRLAKVLAEVLASLDSINQVIEVGFPRDVREKADEALLQHKRLYDPAANASAEVTGAGDAAESSSNAADGTPSTQTSPLLDGLMLDADRAYQENRVLYGEARAREMHDASKRNIGAVARLIEKSKAAERFIAGFEGDELQEGIDELLSGFRDAIRDATTI